MLRLPYTLALLLLSLSAFAQTGPKALVVIAHPDDEGAFSATLYKITNELKGAVDIFVVTNGEAGYKYSTLANPIYKVDLTDEKTGRKYLPAIRRKELTNAGKVLGIRKIYFMNQKDAAYGLNEREPLDTSWNVKEVEKQLDKVLARNKYDYMFCLPPSEGTHGGHKAASILALQAAQRMPLTTRPVVLSGFGMAKGDTSRRWQRFTQLKNYTETAPMTDTANFKVDLKPGIGYQGKLNYNIIKAWEIAEHRSQGTMQLFLGRNSDYEIFWYYKIDDPARLAKTAAFFAELNAYRYPAKTYETNVHP